MIDLFFFCLIIFSSCLLTNEAHKLQIFFFISLVTTTVPIAESNIGGLRSGKPKLAAVVEPDLTLNYQNSKRTAFDFVEPLNGYAGNSYGRKNLFGLTMYYGNCPVESRKIARRIDSLITCKHGGTFQCDKQCENRFDGDEEELLGGRCLSVAGGPGYGFGYGRHGGYTGYGGVCVCFYCKGTGVSDTKCMEGIETKKFDDADLTKALCGVESNTYHEEPGFDDDVVRNNKRSSFGPIPPGPYDVVEQLDGRPHRGPEHHTISSKRCNDKCMSRYSNAEKGVCKRESGYDYECYCKTCGPAEQLWPYENAPGSPELKAKTVDCRDYTPDAFIFEAILPQPLSTQLKACTATDQLEGPERCLGECLKNFVHYRVQSSRCEGRLHAVQQDGLPRILRTQRLRPSVSERCVCELCYPPPCVYDSWNDWSYCSIRCNGGTRRRKRKLIVGDKGLCTMVVEFRTCSHYPCSRDCIVSQWQEWGSCDGRCGSRCESRERQMLVPPLYGGRCYHEEYTQYRDCDTQATCNEDNGSQIFKNLFPK